MQCFILLDARAASKLTLYGPQSNRGRILSKTKTIAAELDIRDLFFALYRKLPWIALAAVMGGALALLGTKLWVIPQYQSSAKLYVAANQRDRTTDAVTLDEIQVTRALAITFVAVLERSPVMSSISEQLTAEFPSEQLSAAFALTDDGSPTLESLWDAVEIEVVKDTGVVDIWAESSDPELSARICALLTDHAPDLLDSIVKGATITTIQEAAIPNAPFSPSLKRNGIVGLLAGLLLSGFFFLLRYVLRASIQEESRLENHLDIPTLATIPDANRWIKSPVRTPPRNIKS